MSGIIWDWSWDPLRGRSAGPAGRKERNDPEGDFPTRTVEHLDLLGAEGEGMGEGRTLADAAAELRSRGRS